jgi:hypothetical protein
MAHQMKLPLEKFQSAQEQARIISSINESKAENNYEILKDSKC